MTLNYLFASVLLSGQLSLFATSQTIETNVCGLPGTPVIVSPATDEATATKDLTVSGTADDNVTVNILDNSGLQASLTSDSSGNYGATITLSSGSNQIVAQAENNCSQTANSRAVTVTYRPLSSSGSSTQTKVTIPTVVSVVTSNSSSQTTQRAASVPVASPLRPLSLTLYVPGADSSSSSGSSKNTVPLGQNFTTTFDSVFITGYTGRPANVEVLESQTVVANIQTDSSGNFGVRIPLKIGDNILSFIIKSEGQTITKTVRITRVAVEQPAKAYSLKRILLYTLAAIVVVEIACFLVLLLVYRRRGNNS